MDALVFFKRFRLPSGEAGEAKAVTGRRPVRTKAPAVQPAAGHVPGPVKESSEKGRWPRHFFVKENVYREGFSMF